jgi:hypothetical protein
MKLRELIIVEDGEAAVATTSSDIATVAYPLFVRGKNNKEKRKNARAAVGQKYVPGPAGIGQGVFENELTERASQLLSAQDRNGVITVVVQAPDGTKRSLADENPRYINQWLMKYDLSLPRSITSKFVGVGEAHVLNHDNVIYRLDRENPMSDTEVAVLGGAGRYSLKALRDKARREAAELAQDLSIEHGGAFRRSAENIKQLTNTINTIVAAYNELARLRRRGGRGSRGITDEDTNFIRECIRVVEQATQNFRLMEARAVEPDAQGYAQDSLTSPQYTVVVNTPGDLDWYKIGMYWHDKIVDPHEFGQDDSDTVMVAQGPEEYKEMMAKIKRMGLTYKEIGGTTDQPEIHSKTY